MYRNNGLIYFVFMSVLQNFCDSPRIYIYIYIYIYSIRYICIYTYILYCIGLETTVRIQLTTSGTAAVAVNPTVISN